MYIHRSCHTRNWGEGAFAPPPLDGQGKADFMGVSREKS